MADILLMLVSVALGGMLGWFIALYIAQPEIKVSIEKPITPMSSKWGKYTALRVLVSNRARSWTLRSPAVRCRGTVTFYDDRGYDTFGKPMEGRWANSAQPRPEPFPMPDGTTTFTIDIDRYNREARKDIYPGENEREPLDIAARYANEVECYAWNNEAYLANGKNQDWILRSGVYLLKVVINVSGRDFDFYFRLHNDGPIASFRLEDATDEETQRISR